MAAKLIVTLVCFALCNASPAFLKTYIFRDGRSYSIGQGYTNNAGGRASGSATISGGVVKAYGSATTDDHRQLGKNAFGVPGEAVAKAEVYDGPGAPENGGSKAVAEAQNTPNFYPLPAPAVVSYQKNFETPAEIIYEYPGNIAQSSAVINDNSESSVTSARTQGSGSAEAKTQGVGSYGITSSNAKTFGSGIGTASSKVNNGYGAANTAARTQGYGSASSKSETGLGSTSAATQTNGGYASSSANNAFKSAVVSASSQGTASSKADIINSVPEVVVSSVKAGNLQRTGWRFGTAYTVPTPGQAQVSSQVNGGSAKSTAHTDGVVTTADAQGYGSANANANLHGGYVNSAANTNGLGYGAVKYAAGNEYGSAHSTVNNGLGNIKSSVNSNGYGNANSHANINEQGSLSSISNSNGHGTAASSAESAPSYAVFRTDGQYIYNPRASVKTQTFGQGSASAKTQGLNSGYRIINSVANSVGSGAAQANASA